MAIVTDSTPLEEPKNPDTCNVFALYKILADADQTSKMRENYLGGNYGYGHAKQALFELMLEKYGSERQEFDKLMSDPATLESVLEKGEEKARGIINNVLDRVRKQLGFA